MINVLVALTALLAGISFYALRRIVPEKTEQVLFFLSLLTCVCFVLYRIFWIQHVWVTGKEPMINALMGSIPLQFCYVCMIMMPIAIRTKKRSLLAICYLITPVFGMVAMLFPDPNFGIQSFLAPNLFFFLLVHWLLVAVGIGLGSTRLYDPRYADIRGVLAWCLVAGLCVHIINNIFTMLGEPTNFMYTMSHANNIGLTQAYHLIPIPFLYLILPAVIFAGISVIRIFMVNLVRKKLHKKDRIA